MYTFHVLLRTSLLLTVLKALVANGCKYVVEGANMPTTLDATSYLHGERCSVHAW